MEKPRCRRARPILSHRERIQVSFSTPLVCRCISDANQNSEERVRKGADKLQKYLNSKQQGRLDGFFTVQPKTSPKKGKDDKAAKGKGKGKEKADTKGTKRKVRICFQLCITLRIGYNKLTRFSCLLFVRTRTRRKQVGVRRRRKSNIHQQGWLVRYPVPRRLHNAIPFVYSFYFILFQFGFSLATYLLRFLTSVALFAYLLMTLPDQNVSYTTMCYIIIFISQLVLCQTKPRNWLP